MCMAYEDASVATEKRKEMKAKKRKERKEKTRKEKTMPFGVNLVTSPVSGN